MCPKARDAIRSTTSTIIMGELASFSETWPAKPMIVVATKMDVAQDPARVEALRKKADAAGMPFYKISAVTGEGLDALIAAIAEQVFAPLEAEPETAQPLP